MRTGLRSYLEDILTDYPYLGMHIAKREQEILYPDNVYKDENIGGGRGGRISNPTASKALTIAQDEKIETFKRYRDAIEKIINMSDPVTNQIIREYYFTRPRTKTWDGIALSVNYSKRHCLNLRDIFFSRLALELGLMKH